jgi:hypothetical protein
MDTGFIFRVAIILAIGYVLGMKFPQWGAKLGL